MHAPSAHLYVVDILERVEETTVEFVHRNEDIDIAIRQLSIDRHVSGYMINIVQYVKSHHC